MGWAISVPTRYSTAHVTVGGKEIAFTDGGGIMTMYVVLLYVYICKSTMLFSELW